ncbi:MAG: hypothetical protein ND866_30725 [Pyrinomonadaceae bacterium]|nr:hypothetical protein [Pyrinomonadaceae bacterium]
MTLDETFERWERIERLVSENAKRFARRSREQTKHLKAYVGAVSNYDVATAAIKANPTALNTKEALIEATESLNRTREALRNSLRH